jgi:hypothetical protein
MCAFTPTMPKRAWIAIASTRCEGDQAPVYETAK